MRLAGVGVDWLRHSDLLIDGGLRPVFENDTGLLLHRSVSVGASFTRHTKEINETVRLVVELTALSDHVDT